MRTVIVIVAAGLLVACQRDLPTIGQDRGTDPASKWISAEQAEQAQLAIDDALARVVPELSFEADTGPLASSLTALLETLREGPLDESALARAVVEVGRYGRTTGADPEELDVIRLALDVVKD
jgi:hypothetical protein